MRTGFVQYTIKPVANRRKQRMALAGLTNRVPIIEETNPATFRYGSPLVLALDCGGVPWSN